jgi:RNA polymerase sigma-70 factor (ECF subfamily)
VSEDSQRLAEEVARRSHGKLVALLAARTRDIAAAEDALADAFVSALVDWPKNGCPRNPEAWLLTVARRKSIDAGRKSSRGEAASAHLALLGDEAEAAGAGAEIPDRRLALMFACAHPSLEESARTPLILQVVLGLDAKAIASAFLTSPSAMGKRLTRAKAKIREAGIPLRIPERDELGPRLEAVLAAIYAAFTEGWTDALRTDSTRADLSSEALYLARLLAGLMSDEPEVLGLLSLLLHAEARRRARRNENGDFVPLAEQDQARWDFRMIEEAEALLRKAQTLAAPGRYQLEAALQSAHVYRCRTGQANWEDVLKLYDALLTFAPSAVVEVNRALAVAEVFGPAGGLAALPDPSSHPSLGLYQPYWAARAELLSRTGAADEARHAWDIAIGLEADPAVRRFLQRRRTT